MRSFTSVCHFDIPSRGRVYEIEPITEPNGGLLGATVLIDGHEVVIKGIQSDLVMRGGKVKIIGLLVDN